MVEFIVKNDKSLLKEMLGEVQRKRREPISIGIWGVGFRKIWEYPVIENPGSDL